MAEMKRIAAEQFAWRNHLRDAPLLCSQGKAIQQRANSARCLPAVETDGLDQGLGYAPRLKHFDRARLEHISHSNPRRQPGEAQALSHHLPDGAHVLDDKPVARTSEQRDRYATLMHSVISQAQAAVPKAVSVERAGRVVADTITSKRPRTRYTVGSDSAIIVCLTRLLSDHMLDSLLARSLRPLSPKTPVTR